MKPAKFTLLVLSVVMIFIACQKDPAADATVQLAASKTEIKAGESVGFEIANAASGLVSKWETSPSTGVSINRNYSWNNRNTISFNTTGTYTVTGVLKKVFCDSVAASHPGMDTCLNGGTNSASVSIKITVTN
jgi:hypothetical protein